MTAPLDTMDRQQEQLAKIERAAMAAALQDVGDQIDALTARAAAAATMSPDAWQGLLDRLVAILDGVDVRAHAVLVQAMAEAWDLGLQHAADQVGLERPLPLDHPPFDPHVADAVREQLAGVRAVLRSNDDIPAALAVAKRTVHRVRAASTWHVNRTAASAVEATSEETGLARRWVAERDACVHCLAYQGEVAGIGQAFAAGLTFGDRPLSTVPVPNPALHPWCRCMVQLHNPADVDVIDALKREAKRSVLRGWSLPSESEPARIRAADRLLRAGAGLPASVEKRARKAVKDGSFAGGRAPAAQKPLTRRPPDPPDPDDGVAPPPNEPVPPIRPKGGRGKAPKPPELDEAGVPMVLGYEYLSGLSPEQEDDLMAHLAVRLDDEDPVELERWAALERYLDYQQAESEYVDEIAEGNTDDEITRLVEKFQRDNGVGGLTHARVGGRGGQQSFSTKPSKRDVQEDYALWLEEQYVLAENATRGVLVTAKAARQGIDGRDLFAGDIRLVYRYASDELLEWFETNRRVSWSEFYYERTGSAAFREAAERSAAQNARIDRDRKGLR